MNIYLPNGYIDFEAIENIGMPFNFIIGARGTGKTYGCIKRQIEQQRMFLYLRRSQAQLQLLNSPDFNPFLPVAQDMGLGYEMKKVIAPVGGVWLVDPNNEDDEGAQIAYTAPLSTFGNLRGFNGRAIKTILYDEIIKEENERGLKNEAYAFFNAYETINRNRELVTPEHPDPEPPVQCYFLCNSESLATDMFAGFGISLQIEKMYRENKWYWINRDRGIAVFRLRDSKISAKKAETALYKVTKGTAYYGMAIENNMRDYQADRYKSRNLNSYQPIIGIGEITVYQHKSERQYYVGGRRDGTFPVIDTDREGRAYLRRYYRSLLIAYESKLMTFESYMCEQIFLNSFEYKG